MDQGNYRRFRSSDSSQAVFKNWKYMEARLSHTVRIIWRKCGKCDSLGWWLCYDMGVIWNDPRYETTYWRDIDVGSLRSACIIKATQSRSSVSFLSWFELEIDTHAQRKNHGLPTGFSVAKISWSWAAQSSSPRIFLSDGTEGWRIALSIASRLGSWIECFCDNTSLLGTRDIPRLILARAQK